MITDTELRVKGMEALLMTLGEVQAERFITLLIREPFDYTQWQRTLWPNEDVRALSHLAMLRRKQNG